MAKITIEVEVEVTGTYTPGYPASRDDPGSDGEVEWFDIEGVYVLARGLRFSLLEGLSDADVNRISSVIMDAVGDEAEDAVREEALS